MTLTTCGWLVGEQKPRLRFDTAWACFSVTRWPVFLSGQEEPDNPVKPATAPNVPG